MQPWHLGSQPFRRTPSYNDLSAWQQDPIAQLRSYVGMRVSWGAVVAGAVALLATSLILWAFGLGVIALAARPTAASLHGSMVALYCCALLTTLVGAFVGGAVASFLRGSPRGPVGVVHGLLSWGLAFVLAFGFQLSMMGGLAGTATYPLDEALDEPVSLSLAPHRHFEPSNTPPP
jgi:hypothetical protein